MARNILFVLAALVAQECLAVPVVLPTSIFPSVTLTGVALPTGAHLDVHQHSLPFSLPPLPTGGAQWKREEDVDLPTSLPSLSVPILTLTDITSLPPLPTGVADRKKERDLPRPTNLSSLSISLPSVSVSLPSVSITLPSLTSIPTELPSLTVSVKDKRQEDAPATPSIPIATATGVPTPPSGLPTGIPTGVPSGLPPHPSGHVVPGGLMRPGRAY